MWFEILILRIVLPVLICSVVTIRPVILQSFIYLLFLFASPFISVRSKPIKTTFYGLLILFSLLAVTLQLSAQNTQVRCYLNDIFFQDNTILGLIDFSNSGFWDICQEFLPDAAIFLTTIIVVILNFSFKKETVSNEKLIDITIEKIISKKLKPSTFPIINGILTMICLCCLCFSGAINPSLINAVYFATFLLFSTLIAMNVKFGQGFIKVLEIMAFVMMLHIISLWTYQLKVVQEMYPAESFTCRLLGFYKFFSLEEKMEFNKKLDLDLLLQPMVLIVSYLTLSNLSRMFLKLEKTDLERDTQYRPWMVAFTHAIKAFIYRQDYIVAVFSMMIWSIYYHSWFGFVYLVAANIMFIMRNQRTKMLRLSPAIVAYACALIIINYIYGLDLTFDELPDSVERVNLKQIGIERYSSFVGIHIIFKSLLTVPFWIIMRQSYDSSAATFMIGEQYHGQKFGSYLLEALNKLITLSLMWIIIILVLVQALYQEKITTMFKIVNVLFFLAFNLAFQVSFGFWKKTMYLFWILLIVYIQGVLIMTYLFQFDGFLELPYYTAIGLRKYETTDLLLKLFSLTMITILTGIQINFYHKQFMKFLLPPIYLTPVEPKEATFMTKVWSILEKILIFVELHFVKAFYFVLFWMCITHVQLVNVLITALLTVGVLLHHEKAKLMILKLISFMSMLIIVLFMLYKLFEKFYTQFTTNDTCDLADIEKRFGLRNPALWFDFNEKQTVYEMGHSYIAIIISLTAFCGFKLLQEHYRIKTRNSKKVPENIFDIEGPVDASYFFKFFVSYGLQAFDVELVLLAMFTLIFQRLDLISIIYVPVIIIMIFMINSRNCVEKFWITASTIVSLLILAQCFILGFLVVFNSCSEIAHGRTFQIGFFSIQKLRKEPFILINDFFLLLVLSCQLKAKTDPLPDLFELKGSNAFNGIKLGMKKFLMNIFVWFSLSVAFIVGTTEFEFFSLGYVLAAFIFCWLGTDFYLKPLKSINRWWNVFIAYNVFIILLRYSVKLFGCLFEDKFRVEYCWILPFFDVPCPNSLFPELFCQGLLNKSEYKWDIFLFFLSIIQKRIFNSKHFNDVIYETFITSLLSARGAQIMEEIRIHEITAAIAEEKRVFSLIKKKMEKITHLATIKNIKDGNVKSHDIAIRNGDYYMFHDDFFEEMEIDEDIQSETPVSTEQRFSERGSHAYTMISRGTEENVEVTKSIRDEIMDFLTELAYKVHRISMKHTLVVKALEEERKVLKEKLSMNASRDAIINILNNAAQKSRRTIVLQKIGSKVEKKSSTRLRKIVESEQLTFKVFVTELFYMSLTQTDMLIYLAILVNQCYYANMLSLPLPLSIFFWATLTFPRPQKTFWIILLAYTQCVILLKTVAQFKILWWSKDHDVIKLLGIDNNDHVAVFDLLLVFALFIHRSVQKAFGIWKTDEMEFSDGTYELDPSVTKQTFKMIQIEKEKKPSVLSSSKPKFVNDNSKSVLLEEVESSKVLLQHQIDSSGTKETLKEVFVDRKKFLKGSEEFYIDDQARLSIKIDQDNSTVILHPIDTVNPEKRYPIEKLVIVEHEFEDPMQFYLSVLKMSFKKYLSLISNFFTFLVPKKHVPRTKSVDVYKYCFFCDFINFFVLLFGFRDFSTLEPTDDSSSILKHFQEDKVPSSLLILILTQFLLIIIDRMLYLRKNMLGKVIYHYALIIVVHVMMFFFLPLKTHQKFNAKFPPVLFYVIKFIYFLLSAYQIRCQYPVRVLGNFLMRQYDLLHLIGHKIFMFIPFLFELVTLIDWTFTPTSLKFFEWLRVDTIYNQVFDIKCIRESAKNKPRGVPQPWWLKILMGGGLTILIVFIIWFPLVLFAYSQSLGQSGVPKNVHIEFAIDLYEPIYKINIREENMIKFTRKEWEYVKSLFDSNPDAELYLKDFDENDVAMMRISSNSSNTWSISPPNLEELIDKSDKSPVSISATYEFHKVGYLMDKEARYTVKYVIKEKIEQERLKKVLQCQDKHLQIANVLPKFMLLSSSGNVAVVEKLSADKNYNEENLQSLYITMNNSTENQKWWQIEEDCRGIMYQKVLSHIPHYTCKNHVNIVLFSEKLFPSTIRSLAAQGILGIYMGAVLFLSRFIRSLLIKTDTVTIIVEELPNVDKILNLCKNIYMVREAKQFSLEEDLVAQLLFLYRSPETLIKWSKYKHA